ncbi:MAG: prolyl oligopeptidase family serine peptidase [Candidatus Limnocylindrales bacterium]
MARRTDPASVIRAQVVLEEHDVARDGRFAVVVRRFVQAGRYRSNLWLVPLTGAGAPRQLTSGAVRDTAPHVSPDGSSIAFRRTGVLARRAQRGAPKRASSKPGAVDDTASLHVLPLGIGDQPGAPWAIRMPGNRSVGELAWSPDGKRLAITLDAGPPRFIQGPEPSPGEAPVVRRIDRLDWRYDESGHLDRWAHLHVVEARRDARPRQVTEGDWGVADIAWSPDGRSIAFSSDPRPEADVLPRSSIWVVDLDPGSGTVAPREALAAGGVVQKPAWSPDGRWLVAVGWFRADALDDISSELIVGPADGSSPPWQLAPDLDRPIGNWVDTDLHGWINSSQDTPYWPDPGTIVALVSDRGRVVPWRFDVNPTTGRPMGAPRGLATGNFASHSLAVASGPGALRNACVTVIATVDSRPMELLTVSLDRAGDERPASVRTSIGGRWSRPFSWPVMREIEAPGPGGPIHTWIASPVDAADRPLPAIVDVHGGPLGAWAPAPSIEVVLLCASGYRVVLPNIRGSTSYGREWIRPQLNDWGGVDAADVHAALDAVIAAGLADPERLGVTGLSYGGFMSNWLAVTSRRFRAAVTDGGVANQVSTWGNGDASVEFNRMSLLGAPLDAAGVANLWRQSPLAHVADTRTPLLILQGEADQRCPPSDNEQLFVALRVLGRLVEYALYPEESHVFQASGRPDRRIDRMARMLAWFDRYVRA